MKKKILVSQPNPTSDKSPYFDIQKKFDVELTFKPFVRVETLTPQEFRDNKVTLLGYTAVVFTTRTALESYFKLINDLHFAIKEDTQYYCLNEQIALYLQKFIVFHKRNVHHSKSGQMEDLITVMKKHNTEQYLIPIAEGRTEPFFGKKKCKLSYQEVVMYRTVSETFTPEEIASYDMMLFFTPANIQALFDNVPKYEQGDQCILTFGAKTAEAARDRGLEIDAEGPTPELPSMAMVLQKFLQDNK